jgi:hypothetical protein
MMHAVTHAFHRLDVWLERTLGRPYHILLSVGLTVEIIRRMAELPGHLKEAPRIAGAIVLVAMNAALLVHQLGEMSHRLSPSARAARRERRRSQNVPRTPPPAAPLDG